MLKNVAIPLMLAATEAEAQKGMKDKLMDAMDMDMGDKMAGLIADADACTPETSNDAVDGISTKAAALSAAQATLALKIADRDALTAAGGAWTVANAARKAAVEAAVAAEVDAGIAGLLDTLDTKMGASRGAQADYQTKLLAYNNGVSRLAAANSMKGTVDAEKLRLEGLQTKLTTAVNKIMGDGAGDVGQIAKETLWREWLYCELGDAVVGDTTTSSQWWKLIASDSAIVAAGTAPAKCTVPAVRNAANDGDERPAVEYWTQSALVSVGDVDGTQFLGAEVTNATPWKKWTAHRIYANALAAENATTDAFSDGQQRTKKGEVAYNTGSKRAADFVVKQRQKEAIFYGRVLTSRGTAATEAGSQATGAAHVTGAAAANLPLPNSSVPGLGLTAATDGAKKLLDAAATARDSAATGSVKAIGQARAQSATTNLTWMTAWTDTPAAVTAWKTANASSPNDTYTWFTQTNALTTALDAWYGYTIGELAIAAQKTASTAVGSAKKCNTGAGTGTWTQSAGSGTKAACETACVTMNNTNLLLDPGTNLGGTVAPVYLGAALNWCGAYSWDHGNTQCHLQYKGDDATAGTAGDAADVCFKITNAKKWGDAQELVRAKYALVTQSMVAAANTQAALEKSWLQAWYKQQYWAAIVTELGVAETGSKALAMTTLKAAVDGGGVTDNTTTAGAVAAAALVETALNNAAEALATLKATTATADATKAELGKRILRADAELTQLGLLANVGKTGTLDEAKKLRDAEVVDYTAAGAAFALAYTELRAASGTPASVTDDALIDAACANASCPVKARSGIPDETGGSLTEAMEVAKAALASAVGEQVAAQSALDAALTSASQLTDLRATVVADTATWTGQETALTNAVGFVTAANGDVDTAQTALDKAVAACQIAAYDKYRETLEAAMVQRNTDLKTIKALIKANEAKKPAAGKADSRCEKALSNGTWRPKRGEKTCDEGLCCGASRIWMNAGAGAGTVNAAWRTIETCQAEDAKTFAYVAERAPMALEMPVPVAVGFKCIEGAKKLAAAASAVAAAVYMLA